MITPTWNRFKEYLCVVFLFGFLIGFLLGLWIGEAESAEIHQDVAVRCIIGEAAGEGAESMLWHAAAIRNRGTLKGVYGCKSNLIDREPAWVADRALQAWLHSAKDDPTHGADHWGSTLIDKSWIQAMDRKMVFKGQIKNTRFYKS